MAHKTGVRTRTGVVIPGLNRLKLTSLSKPAKQRLRWIDYYHAHDSNARLTCRHYGIAHRTFYRYYNRYKVQGLSGLESRSHRPNTLRTPNTPVEVISLIKQLRKDNPEYSKYKIAKILKREHGLSVSDSTVGRTIKRHNLFFRPPIKPKQHPQRLKNARRLRKPKDLQPRAPGQLIEFDVKHLPNLGSKRYGFVAIDVVSKQATIHVASTISSRQAAIAWGKTVDSLGLPEAVLTDNGSENFGSFEELVASQSTNHYWAKVRTPKDKPHVERFIGSLERECIQWGGVAQDLADQQDIIDKWLDKYHNYRPHQSLDYLTPNEYQAKLKQEVALIM